MRHRKAGRKFGRNTSHRRAMLRNLAGNLVLHERIETTEAKAKELRRVTERLLTKAIRLGDDLTLDIGKLKEDERDRVVGRRVHAQRDVAKFLPKRMARQLSDGSVEEVDLVHKLFHDLAPRFVERAQAGKGGGYTRIIKLVNRRGDNAPMALIEFVGAEDAAPGADEAEEAPSSSEEE